MELTSEELERIKQLKEKYAASGQDMQSYLEGLLHSKYLTYWEYINLDVLLNLQQPRTHFPDENIFILYHQITELYFKLVLHAMHQITEAENPTKEAFITQLTRIIFYFKQLAESFEIMVTGMDREQFLEFRMALLPASGFQSAQYRIIEICATDAYNLISIAKKAEVAPDASMEEKYEHFYWKMGGKELATGKKTLTLQQFEEKYTPEFIKLLYEYQDKNLWRKYKQLPEADQQDEELVRLMKMMDMEIEVKWPLMHYRSAVRHLQKEPEDIKATGGTNWQKYLPPRFQHIHLYPLLLTDEEKKNWGKQAE